MVIHALIYGDNGLCNNYWEGELETRGGRIGGNHDEREG